MAGVKWRLTVLDWVRIGVLAAGLLCVATGLLPGAEAAANIRRIGPLLLFLAAVIVLAELTKEANVFDVLAGRLAIIGRGNYAALFVLCTAFASFVTIFLNLDTTAVLLTPVMLALAPRARITPLPLAMTTIWLANTASLLLPVSNLTNLLAMGRVGLSTRDFAGRMWAPQAAAIAVTMLLLWIFFWRRGERGEDRYTPPPPAPAGDPVLFGVASAACVLFIAAILAGVQIGVAAAVAAVVVIAAFAWRDRAKLTWSLFPWQLLVFVSGLFLVVPTLSRYGLNDLMRALIGSTGDALGDYRAAAAGAALSNVVNNLPAYAAGEAVIPATGHDQLLSLLIGTNVGPVITPWASLATLLWFEWCRRRGVKVPMVKFVLTGLTLAVTGLAATIAALLLTA
ncbi:arsenic transporter [Sphaerisporangium krabiense]|uniref:Arsenical pump membrane protein n=1 Tax=Sphaerisporangium krabiense TaxID=763782 RepID=A0A7W8Z8Q9_9ACTN|nr:SLC13 family permease [Sphaerisporangium krabiense]MBB5629411.1 arsenical pump membrane protein [Sphaerisporangium krabiense]GII65738.1 arsenic transporter [Sphaerisporangium krabiense]